MPGKNTWSLPVRDSSTGGNRQHRQRHSGARDESSRSQNNGNQDRAKPAERQLVTRRRLTHRRMFRASETRAYDMANQYMQVQTNNTFFSNKRVDVLV